MWQIFILNKFDEKKMYTNKNALKEKERLDGISLNTNISNWEKDEKGTLKISYLNCRSLQKHYEDIITDPLLLNSDFICLQETWLEVDNTMDYEIPGFSLHLNSYGKGKGIAIYFKKDIFKHEIDIKEENMQLTKFTSSVINIVGLYRSQNGHHDKIKKHLEELTTGQKPELVIGDFNFCSMATSSNQTKKFFQENEFTQLIREPTHLLGNLLDQAHIRDTKKLHVYSSNLHSKYYSDHKALAILVKIGK